MVDNSSRFTKGVILVVAGDSSQGEELHEMLQGAGYKVVVTSGGQGGRNFELADKQLAVLFCPRDRWRIKHMGEVCDALSVRHHGYR